MASVNYTNKVQSKKNMQIFPWTSGSSPMNLMVVDSKEATFSSVAYHVYRRVLILGVASYFKICMFDLWFIQNQEYGLTDIQSSDTINFAFSQVSGLCDADVRNWNGFTSKLSSVFAQFW